VQEPGKPVAVSSAIARKGQRRAGLLTAVYALRGPKREVFSPAMFHCCQCELSCFGASRSWLGVWTICL